MNKKKICFIAQFPPPIHGLSKAVDTLYNSYLQNEFDFEKIDITNNKKFFGNVFRILFSKADLYYFTISQTKGGNIRDLIIFKLISIKKGKCVIHLHGGYYRKFVDNLGNLQKKLNFKAVKKLDGAIVLGNSLKSIFKDMIDDNKIFVVPNCIDNEFLMSDDEFNKKTNNYDKGNIKHILYLSNFIKEKGYRNVLELAKYEKNLCEKGKKKDFHFDFAGNFFDNNEKEFFFNYIKENKLDDYITYHGVVGGKEKADLLKLCRGFILLTRYPNEGQPISILEAMGNGMIIITTDHAGIPDVVENNINGIVFSNNCENQIDLVYSKIKNKFDEAYKNIAVKNREDVLSCYREDTYLKNMLAVFNKIKDC